MRYSIIPVRAIEDPHIHGAALRVLVSLGSYADRDGFCYPSQSTLARRLRVSRQAINQQIRVLEQLGYLQITRRKNYSGDETSCLYRIYFEDPTPLESKEIGGVHSAIGMGADDSAPFWKAEGEGADDDPTNPEAQLIINIEQGDTETQYVLHQDFDDISTLSETLMGASAAISDIASGESVVIAPPELSDVASGESVVIAPPALSDVAQTTQLTSHITTKKKEEVVCIRNETDITFVPSSSLFSNHARDPAFQPQEERDQ